MKRFLKPKLIFSIVTVLLLVSAVTVALASGPRGNSRAASSRSLVLFLQGINSSEPDLKLNQIVGFNTVLATVQGVLGTTNVDYLEYSYKGSATNGNPMSYGCVPTFTQSILTDISRLNEQIARAVAANHDTDIYLIGHSLGGVVALGYLDFLEAPNVFHASFPQETTLPSGTNLKAVITLDSPIGGVHDSNYLTDANFLFTTPTLKIDKLTFTNPALCKGLKGKPFTSPTELTKVYTSVSKTTPPEDTGPDPHGADASLLALPGVKLPSVTSVSCAGVTQTGIPSNECLTEDAQTDLGTSFLSVGNLNDFLWKPSGCVKALNFAMGTSLPVSVPNFVDTQFLEDEGDGLGLYGRDFSSILGFCRLTLLNKLNHLDVLSDSNVQTGIGNFLSPVGGTPSPLAINPFQPPEP